MLGLAQGFAVTLRLLLVLYDGHEGGENLLQHRRTHPAHAFREPHGIHASSLEHICGRCLSQSVLPVRLNPHLLDVTGKAVVPAGDRHNQLKRQLADGIGTDDNSRACLLHLSAEHGVKADPPDFPSRRRGLSGTQQAQPLAMHAIPYPARTTRLRARPAPQAASVVPPPAT